MRTVITLLIMLVCTSAWATADEPDRRPSDAIAEAGLLAGVRGWRTTYRESVPTFAYGLHGGWFFRPWLELTAAVDHARRTLDPADLVVRNTETWLLLGPRLSLWVEFLRFFVNADGGPVLRTASYVDSGVRDATRLTAGFGGGGGLSVVIGHRVSLTTRLAWRHRDDRSNILGTLDVSWLFHRSTTQ